MKVLLVNGSPRLNGNTRLALETIGNGVRNNRPNWAVEMIDIAEHKISGCIACGSCKKNGGSCVLDDETNDLVEQLAETDLVILGTPVYWWGVSAQLKLFIDKWFSRGKELGSMHKKLGLVAVGAAPVTDREYGLIEEQMKCICEYMGWDFVFSEAISASGAGDVSAQTDTMERLGRLYKML